MKHNNHIHTHTKISTGYIYLFTSAKPKVPANPTPLARGKNSDASFVFVGCLGPRDVSAVRAPILFEVLLGLHKAALHAGHKALLEFGGGVLLRHCVSFFELGSLLRSSLPFFLFVFMFLLLLLLMFFKNYFHKLKNVSFFNL